MEFTEGEGEGEGEGKREGEGEGFAELLQVEEVRETWTMRW
jgi:hypothetical protein